MKSSNVWQLLCAVLLAGFASGAAARWDLDSQQSAINFVSVKNASIAEVHRFDSLEGSIVIYNSPDNTHQLFVAVDPMRVGIAEVERALVDVGLHLL